MEIINLPRGRGKTTSLIVTSSIANMPIVVATRAQYEYVVQRAKELNIKIMEPIIFTKFINDSRYYTTTNQWKDIQGVLIDELDYTLKQIFEKPVCGATITDNNFCLK